MGSQVSVLTKVSLVSILTPILRMRMLNIGELRIPPHSSDRNPEERELRGKVHGVGTFIERQKSCVGPGDLNPRAWADSMFLRHTLLSPQPLAFSLLAPILTLTSLLCLPLLASDLSTLDYVPTIWTSNGGTIPVKPVVQLE